MSEKQNDGNLFFGCFGMIVICILLFAGCAAFMDGDSDGYDREDYNQDGEYQPADSMTDDEIETELNEIIEGGE